ncbi:MAG: histidine kinase, partial [Clostridiaceae bacterium]|nr:histidine kinase [Clostridiaceae bacterium]
MKKTKNFLQKLVVSYLVIALIPVIGFLTAFGINRYYETEKNTMSRLTSSAETVSAQMDRIYSDMAFISIDLLSRGDFYATTKKLYYNSRTPQSQREYYRILVDNMVTYSLANSIYQVIFFNPEGYFISNYHYNIDYHYGSRIDRNIIEGLSWLPDVQEKEGAELLLPVEKNAFFEHDTDVIGLGRAIRDPGSIIGYIIVQADMDKLSYVFESSSLLHAGVRVLSEGRVIYENGLFPREQDYGRYLMVSKDSPSTGITIMMAKTKADVLKEAMDAFFPLIVQGIVMLAIMICCIVIYSRKLSRPLIAFTKRLEKVTLDNLDMESEFEEYHDYYEIEYLCHAFADMRNRLNFMINETIVYKSLQMEERFRALQSQMNPHFMYNTLNVIGIMGLESGNNRINDACIKLSGLLRYSISDPYSNSTFAEEFDNIESYLELMKLRYEHKLSYRISLDERLKPLELPKLVLQPFVENALEHAFDKEHKSIDVHLSGELENGRWKIVISDNGKGFAKDSLDSLKKEVESFIQNDYDRTKNAARTGGIGVRNTIARLDLYYEGFTYSFSNAQTGGAVVILS